MAVIETPAETVDAAADTAAPARPGPTGLAAVLGSADHKVIGRLKAPLLSAEIRSCFAMTEPEAGSDAHAISCEAVRDGEGYVLNGTKTFISNGQIGDLFAVDAGEIDVEFLDRGIGDLVDRIATAAKVQHGR